MCTASTLSTLEAAWAQRASDTPLKSADEALILASIVEKERGAGQKTAHTFAVFTNRLRVGMLLQTDPNGHLRPGEKFDGNLRKRYPQTDHPWNTYTRPGLPPTPIAMPGQGAAGRRSRSRRARCTSSPKGDGSVTRRRCWTSTTRAVNRYQRGRTTPPEALRAFPSSAALRAMGGDAASAAGGLSRAAAQR